MVNIWFSESPLLALAPAIEPVLVPNIQANVLEMLAVKVKFGLVPLQILAVLELVIAGLGFTITVIAVGLPTQEPVVEVGVTL